MPSRIVRATIAALLIAVPAFAQDAATSTPAPASDKAADNMQILKDKLRADKKLVVAEAMELTEAEGKTFWPVYDAYQKDLSGVQDRSIAMIKDYAANYGAMTDAIAKKLIDSFVALEKDRWTLTQQYLPKFRKAIPELKVARYFQIENKIRAVVNYELASAIPLAE